MASMVAITSRASPRIRAASRISAGSPKNAVRLLASIRELDAGQGHSRELVEDEGPGAA